VAAYAGDIIVDETDEEAFYRRVREGLVEVSQPSLSEMTFSKFTDASSPVLFHLATLRRPLRRAVIEHVFDRTTTRFTLSPVFISSFSAAADQMPEKDEDEDEDGEQHEDYGRESLSLNFHSVEMHVVDKVRRPLALPKTPAFGMYDPHQAEGAFPLPLELIVSVFLWLDQQSLSRAAQVASHIFFCLLP
jgi:type VI protein secretion system component Hcp